MYPQIILLGDSVTQGMTTNIQAWLQTRYSRRADVVNRGFSGFTSRQALTHLPIIVPSSKTEFSPDIKLCFVFFGANDAFHPPQTPGVPRVAVEHFSDNISRIIEYLKSVTKECTVVLVTPPAVDEYSLPDTGLSAERVASYASATRDVSIKYGLPIADCSRAFLKYSGWSENSSDLLPLPGSRLAAKNDALASLLTDGLHLSAKGYEVLFHEIVTVLEKIPQASFSNMPVVISDNEFGAIWDDFGAYSQVTEQVGYPVTEQDRNRVLAKKMELEESIGMTIDEFFQPKKSEVVVTGTEVPS